MLNHENDSVTADENAVPGVLLFYCHQSLQSAIQLLLDAMSFGSGGRMLLGLGSSYARLHEYTATD